MPKDILKQILISDDVVESINDNIETLFSLIPELQPMVDFPHNHPHHHLDVWQHTLLALRHQMILKCVYPYCYMILVNHFAIRMKKLDILEGILKNQLKCQNQY